MFKRSLTLICLAFMVVTTVGLAQNNYGKHYLILVAPEWENHTNVNGYGLNNYIDWLTHRGYHVTKDVVPCGRVVFDRATPSNPSVWKMIHDWYDAKTGAGIHKDLLYVLLVGDAPYHNPSRDFKGEYMNSSSMTGPPNYEVEVSFEDELIPTFGDYPFWFGQFYGKTWSDHFYSLMTGTPPDNLVNEPDITVGRWCARSADQLSNIIRKQFYYEGHPDFQAGLKAWDTEEVLFLGSGDYNIAKVNSRLYLPGEDTMHCIFNSPKADTISDSLNNDYGVSIVNYRGHGFRYGWGNASIDPDNIDPNDPEFVAPWFDPSVEPSPGDGMFYNWDNVRSLYNVGQYPMVFSVCCLTGCITAPQHDVWPDPPGSPVPPVQSFIEEWVNEPLAGGVGAFGASRITGTDINNHLDSCIFRALFEGIPYGGENTITIKPVDVGHAINYAKKRVLNELPSEPAYKKLQDVRAYHWVGDPGLMPWHGDVVDVNGITVAVTPSNDPTDTICYYDGNSTQGSIPTGTQVNVRIESSFNHQISDEPAPLVMIGPDVGAEVGLYYTNDVQDTVVRFGRTVKGLSGFQLPIYRGIVVFSGVQFNTQGKKVYITLTHQTTNNDTPWPMTPKQVAIDVTGGYPSPELAVNETHDSFKWSISCPKIVSSSNVSFSYTTPQAGAVSLKIFDASGRTVQELTKTHNSSGSYELLWNGRDKNNTLLPNGVYFFRFEGTDYRHHGKVTILR